MTHGRGLVLYKWQHLDTQAQTFRELLMEVWTILADFNKTRRLVEDSSDGCSGFWRHWFGTPLARLVYTVKKDYQEEFENLFADCSGLLDSLNLGHQALFQERVLHSLDFSSPGRTTAGVAFVVFLVDKWSQQTHLTRDYILDFTAMHLWKAWVRQRGQRILNYWLLQPAAPGLLRLHRQTSMLEEEMREAMDENPRSGLDPPSEEELD